MRLFNFMFAGPYATIHPIHIILFKPFLHFLIDLLILGSCALVSDKNDSVLSRQYNLAMLCDLDVGYGTVNFFRVEDGC